MIQLASCTQPLVELPDDCAGDDLDFLHMGMARKDSLLIAAHCSSPDAHAFMYDVAFEAVKHKATADLGLAAEEGDYETPEDCLDESACVDLRYNCDSTALIKAAGNGHAAIVKLIQERRYVNSDMKNRNGFTALMMASFNGYTDCVKYLLEAGADIELNDNSSFTALMHASSKGHTGVVNILCERGAGTEAKDSRGLTALMKASFNGHTDTMESLILDGADKEAKDEAGSTALLHASGRGHADTVGFLLLIEAKRETKNNHGSTPLMLASLFGHTVVVELLLKQGVRKKARDHHGKTALIKAANLWPHRCCNASPWRGRSKRFSRPSRSKGNGLGHD